jgi:hypothetical protein
MRSPLTDSNRRPPPYHGGFELHLRDAGKRLIPRFSCKLARLASRSSLPLKDPERPRRSSHLSPIPRRPSPACALRRAASRSVAEARAEGAGVSKKTRPAPSLTRGAGRGSPGLGRPPRRSLHPGTGFRPPFHAATSRPGLRRSGPSARMRACFDCAEAFLWTCYVARAVGPAAQSPCPAAFRARRIS